MADSDTELIDADMNDAASFTSTTRRSARIATRHEETGLEIQEMLTAQGINPAPGLDVSQLRSLANEVGLGSPAQDEPITAAPGRKRAKKTHHGAPPAKRKAGASSSAQLNQSPDLSATLQLMVNSIQAIDARLQSIEDNQASSSSARNSAQNLQYVTPPAPAPQQAFDLILPQHSLASAIPNPFPGRPYIPSGANILPRLRAKILQGKDINLISLILPSPEYDDRRQDLDGYLGLIGDLNLRYGNNTFFKYHKGFSSKAAVYLAQSNIRLNWGVLDTELLVLPWPKGAQKRLIFDLSAPHTGSAPSVNSLIPPEPFSLHYSTVDNAIKLIKLAGQGASRSKTDIIEAFKIIPIHPSQWHLFGFKWESKLYFAVRLTFGCKSSPAIFNQVSEALCWILLNRVRVPSLLHLLDDFLLIDPPQDNAGASLSKLKLMFKHLGVPLSDEKTTGPTTCLEFLGITLDTIEMKASLPAEKLERIGDISQSYTTSEVVTKQDLLSLLGHLNYAMRVVPQGRSYISSLLDLASSVPNLHDVISLNEGCRSDLRFWSRLLRHWNGVTFFYDDVVHSSDSIKFFTDAAPSVGFGGYYQGQWFANSWPHSFPKLDPSSALYEIHPIAVACPIWGKFWRRKRIAVQCDNQAVVGIINKGRSSSLVIMPFMRCISWLSVTQNFILTARFVPGHTNVIADALSRFKFQVFRSLCPEANSSPTAVPPLEALILY
ncbi:uncharacterized protein [Cebidichthys violaceus]|uniref:uncharacterized protein n=1 Tax=Cebidichthys violaceus TaxID=271503 RepID=UPI0035CBB91F